MKNCVVVSWSMSTEDLIAHYGDIKINTFFT